MDVNLSTSTPISMAYQLLEECPFNCPICHGRINKEQRPSTDNIIKWIEGLSSVGVRRLTITGGEPMLLHDQGRGALLEICQEIHRQRIHLCLNTSGVFVDYDLLQEFDTFLDQMLLSFRGIDKISYNRQFGVTEKFDKLHKPYHTALRIMEDIKHTGIKLEVATVVDAKNVNETIQLGWKLLSINPNITWRVEEYYANGAQPKRQQFELRKAVYDELFIQITETFAGKFFRIRHSSKEGRIDAPDVMLTPEGNFVRSSNNAYTIVGKMPQLPEMNTRRRWSDYSHGCRDWGWNDLYTDT